MTEANTVRLTVLKPFVLSLPAGPGSKLAIEHKFVPQKDDSGRWLPTEMDFDPKLAAHPFIRDQHADGCIESAAAKAARLKAKAKALKKRKEIDDKAMQQANEAMRRATGGAEVRATNEADVERDLNTPVNELQNRQGADIGAT
jgi:hypothetical protein